MAIPTFDFDEAIAAHEEDCAQRQQLERLKRSTATIVDPRLLQYGARLCDCSLHL
jgi:hypothetical protein